MNHIHKVIWHKKKIMGSALLAALMLTGGGLLEGSISYAADTTNVHGTAFGDKAAVTGGDANVAGGSISYGERGYGFVPKEGAKGDTVSGGNFNEAYGTYSSVNGGSYNTASGKYSSVNGGEVNNASGENSTVNGGMYNRARGSHSTISGGYWNFADKDYSSVSGGANNTAQGECSSISGGGMNFTKGESSSVSGGWSNIADGQGASISGGAANRTYGKYASISGGEGNMATGTNSSVSGGAMNLASGEQSYAGGGEHNKAVGPKSTAIGGKNNFVYGYEYDEPGTRPDPDAKWWPGLIDYGSVTHQVGVGSAAVGGQNSVVQGDFSTGVAGGSTGAGVNDALAAGSQSVVTVSNGTALGYQSTANQAGTISFGHEAGDVSGYDVSWQQKATQKDGKYYDVDNEEITEDQYYDLMNRDGTWNDYTKNPTITAKTYSSASYNRLVKVADGVDDHDVVVMEQLKKAMDDVSTKDTRNTVKAGENVTLDTKDNADGSHEYTVNVKADGKVAASDTKLVSGDTVYNETRVQKDGNYIKQANTAGENLTALDNQVANNAQNIYHMDNRISNLDNRVNKVGAGAAALAALHPLDFDPADKWDFAVGYGNYRNANSVAFGAFYRPNEDTMFSIGTNFGNGENMFNAGLSFKIGQGSGVTTSRTAMAKKIESLENTLDEQNKKIAELEALIQQYIGKK